MYYMIEISFSLQKSCLNILKPSGSLVASYHSYVLNEPKRQQREGVFEKADLPAVTFLVLNSTSRRNTLLLSSWILMINSLLLAVMKYWKLLEIQSRLRVSLSQLLVTWILYTNRWYILYNIPLTLSTSFSFIFLKNEDVISELFIVFLYFGEIIDLHVIFMCLRVHIPMENNLQPSISQVHQYYILLTNRSSIFSESAEVGCSYPRNLYFLESYASVRYVRERARQRYSICTKSQFSVWLGTRCMACNKPSD